ncbi:MAG: hypothetical protein LH472_02835 [Pyrinomonadaceae bacterium]|nr:hypothetical protein [Pyrinomonadaceae bacterium]
MLEKLLQAVRDFLFINEQLRRNTEEIKELRKRVEDLTLFNERLAFEIQRTRENEAHEREKLVLRSEKESPKPEKKFPRGSNKKQK